MIGRSAIDSIDGRCDGTRPSTREHAVDDQRGDRHRHEHHRDEQRREPAAVVLPVGVDDRDDDQVGEDERDHAGERDAAAPEHGRERDVPDRADERERRDERADDHVLDDAHRTPRRRSGTAG